MRNGSECGDGDPLVRLRECNRQGTMTTHAAEASINEMSCENGSNRQGQYDGAPVSSDRATLQVERREVSSHELGQLLRDVGLHLIVRAPGRLSGVAIESRSETDLPIGALIGEISATRRSIADNDG